MIDHQLKNLLTEDFKFRVKRIFLLAAKKRFREFEKVGPPLPFNKLSAKETIR